MLEVSNIHVYLGESYTLQGVSLQVHNGEIVCLLGRNGAGKTTTMRSIMGYWLAALETLASCSTR